MRRSVLAKARQLTQAAFDTSIDINQAVSGAIRDLAVDASPDKSAVHIAEHLDALYDDVERRSKDPKDIWGIKTGFRDIDRYIIVREVFSNIRIHIERYHFIDNVLYVQQNVVYMDCSILCWCIIS